MSAIQRHAAKEVSGGLIEGSVAVRELVIRDTAAWHQCENQNMLARNRALIDGKRL
jgi:hypothetical protein